MTVGNLAFSIIRSQPDDSRRAASNKGPHKNVVEGTETLSPNMTHTMRRKSDENEIVCRLDM